MYSWVFRHRRRLQVVYGVTPTPPLAGRRFEQGSARANKSDAPAPGQVVWRRRWALVVPMPPTLATEDLFFADS